ncbi:hypothetical protein NOVOSPHI9U_310070 [Novosphingobium sp. 9U]|nr:hypothetical protein NOVOSPHI9U_310070 [Novosphingobium sp. 9U]
MRTNDWHEVLLEQWSGEKWRKLGCVQKPLARDFTNAFAPSHRCCLLPLALLQRAWRLNGRRWVEEQGQQRVRSERMY